MADYSTFHETLRNATKVPLHLYVTSGVDTPHITEKIWPYLEGLLGMVVILTNVFVMVSHWSSKRKRHINADIYVFYLSVADFLVGFFILLLSFVWRILSYVTIPPLVCHAWLIAMHFSILSSAMIIILLSYDRLQLVMSPFRYHATQNSVRVHRLVFTSGAICFIYCVVIYSFGLLFLQDVELGRIDIQTCIPGLLNNGIYLVLLSVFDFFGPFIVLATLNLVFYWKLVDNMKATSIFQQREKEDFEGRQLSAACDHEKVEKESQLMKQISQESNGHMSPQWCSPAGGIEIPNKETPQGSHNLPHVCEDVPTGGGKRVNRHCSFCTLVKYEQSNRQIEIVSVSPDAVRFNMQERNKTTLCEVAEAKRRMENARLTRIAKKLAVYVLLFMLCWLPYEIVACLPVFGVIVPSSVANVTGLILMFNSLLNPLLYAVFRNHRSLLCTKFGTQ